MVADFFVVAFVLETFLYSKDPPTRSPLLAWRFLEEGSGILPKIVPQRSEADDNPGFFFDFLLGQNERSGSSPFFGNI